MHSSPTIKAQGGTGARQSHSFPLPHFAPRVPTQHSLKPRYSPWPTTPEEESMDAQWAQWYAPYLQQLGTYGWVWDGKRWNWGAQRVEWFPMKTEETWLDRGIDPRLIYRSPSPETEETVSSPCTQRSSLLDSPDGSSQSSLPPSLFDFGSEDEEELETRMNECFTTPPTEYEQRGGKRKYLEELGSEGSEDGDDECDDQDLNYTKPKPPKRPRLSKLSGKRRPQRRRPPPSRDVKPRAIRRLVAHPPPVRPQKAIHEQTEVVFSCPYHLSSTPHLTCGACFSSETDVRRHAATHLAKEYYQQLNSSLPAENYMFAGLAPRFIYCSHTWCSRPFLRKDALPRHMAGSCLCIADRSKKGKKERLEQARALVLRGKEHWVHTPARMPHSVEAVTAKVEGQQKRVITRIVRVLSTYGDSFDIKRVKDGEEMEVWWARGKGKGNYKVFERALDE
ncbi:hypothetical protein DACRYDRAFT_20153 [Dacryopinax primogenitus]|uniref:Uncharacterized protein n=1 Tax=Dacryopinax primogenitus (strain DJM 731) TaxID=1858805 RepID=M5GBJ3_DACPD|nr:uncharacterized protein DACRYDRAFT_20153 [Dacryopinax primogenitus]EJU05770.1 hypothetical protein DACRYDRAFT_20153 [Dacryopinax primogenitus]